MTNPIYRTKQWRTVRLYVLARDGHRCKITDPHKCAIVANTVDHIIELADGGAPYAVENLQAACASGNAAKRNAAVARRARGTFRTSRPW